MDLLEILLADNLERKIARHYEIDITNVAAIPHHTLNIILRCKASMFTIDTIYKLYIAYVRYMYYNAII